MIYTSDLFLSDMQSVARNYVADIDGFVGSDKALFFHTNGSTIQQYDMLQNTDQVNNFYSQQMGEPWAKNIEH